jgi:CheY-like chemotaxis protein
MADKYLNRKVLVVEDEEVTQKVVARMLATLGLIVDIARDGQAALNAAQIDRYDLVLMDIHLPGIDGFATTKRIRGNHFAATAADVPIVALTSDRRGADVAPCLQAGMNGHLAKPVNFKYLSETLDRYLPAD